MKTFETEKHNIPEGATHYRDECEDFRFAWVMFDDGELMVDTIAIGWSRFKHSEFEAKVKPIPQTKDVDWENGLPPVGEECEKIFNGKSKIITPLYYDDHTSGMVMFYHCDSDAGIQSEYDWCLVENCIFRKPETPEAKKEREELESAYSLYCDWCKGSKYLRFSFDEFKETLMDKDTWIAIVRKTGYRVEK